MQLDPRYDWREGRQIDPDRRVERRLRVEAWLLGIVLAVPLAIAAVRFAAGFW